MKRKHKITWIIMAAIVVIAAAVFVCADVIVSRMVGREVNKALAELPGCQAQCGRIHVRFFSGTAEVDDLRFGYRGEPVSKRDTVRPGVEIIVDRVDVGRVFYSVLLKKRILVSDVYIKHPQVELWMDEKHPETCFPQLHDDGLEQADKWLDRADLMNLHIKNACLRLHSVRTKLDVAVDSCSLTVHDLAYDSVFSYCDSVYRFSLEHAAVTLPDGRMRIETNDIEHEDQGALILRPTRIANTMARKRLGDIVKEPVTWMDMQLERVETAPLNPIRKALAKDYTLESANVVIARMDVFRDERYKPKEPFAMPQEILMAMPVTFRLGHVDAHIKKIDIEFASTNINCGELHLNNIKTAVDNISNKKNSTMRVSGSCPIEKGEALAEMSMTMNQTCDFTTRLHVQGADAAFLNPFIRPLIGITFALQLDTLDTHYSGNKTKANGYFRMLYHGLDVKVHKEDDIPYKIVTKNANTFTTLANTLLPKSNPTSVDIRPRAYEVEWTRDVWKPFPLYMFGPCIDGAKKTLLPGLYVHKQAKN